MTRAKQTGRKTASSGTSSNKPGAQVHADRLSKTLSGSAQQIWLAGVGAFGRAQVEGTRLFETLVKEGLGLQQTARRFAGARAEEMRDAVGQARGHAAGTWDRLEKAFEDRVQRALVNLDVPGRHDLAGLSARIETLTAELRRQNGVGAPRKSASPRRASPAAKKATGEPSVKKAMPRRGRSS